MNTETLIACAVMLLLGVKIGQDRAAKIAAQPGGSVAPATLGDWWTYPGSWAG